MISVYQKFLASLKQIKRNTHGEDIAVALSGGVDSVVLLNLLVRYKKEHDSGLKIHALTVDHGLRDESSNEAKEVGEMVQSYPIMHKILKITEEINKNQVEKHARELRYRLMYAYCEKVGIKNLYVGHHLDDQIETFAMRLKSGSTLFGLMGIKRVQASNLNGKHSMDLIRPMLGLSKTEIYEYAEREGLRWFEDGTNKDVELTTRNRIRDLLRRKENEDVKNNLITLHDKTCCVMMNCVYTRMEELESKGVDMLSGVRAYEEFDMGFLRTKLRIILPSDMSLIPTVDCLVLDRWIFNKVWRVSPHERYLYGFTKFDSLYSVIEPPKVKKRKSLTETILKIPLGKQNKLSLAGCEFVTVNRRGAEGKGGGDLVIDIVVSREKPHRHERTSIMHIDLGPGETQMIDGRYFLTGPLVADIVPQAKDLKSLQPLLTPKRALFV